MDLKISDVYCILLEGALETTDGVFWEERVSRPVDVYPSYRDHGVEFESISLTPDNEGRIPMKSVFVCIETTTPSLFGIFGPLQHDVHHIVLNLYKPLLIGKNPIAVETIWDQLYRSSVHGWKGFSVLALSAIDCALWDIRGKYFKTPVYQLLGGPTRTHIPAYASMLGFSVDPNKAKQRAKEFKEMGYFGQKWFPRSHPSLKGKSLNDNVELVKSVREGMGEESELMLDCWMSWDLYYCQQIAPLIAPYKIRWIEEPVLPHESHVCAQIRKAVPFPVANGEHSYSRWDIHKLLQEKCQDVLQPDIAWVGGITEMMKVCALASTYGVQIPHGHSSHATANVIASQPPSLCPAQEYLVKWNEVHQFFVRDKVRPVQGIIELPTLPGLGIVIDDSVVLKRTVLR